VVCERAAIAPRSACRSNSKQAQIKERVEVCPENQAVADVVCCDTLVRNNVRGFQRLHRITARDSNLLPYARRSLRLNSGWPRRRTMMQQPADVILHAHRVECSRSFGLTRFLCQQSDVSRTNKRSPRAPDTRVCTHIGAYLYDPFRIAFHLWPASAARGRACVLRPAVPPRRLSVPPPSLARGIDTSWHAAKNVSVLRSSCSVPWYSLF